MDLNRLDKMLRQVFSVFAILSGIIIAIMLVLQKGRTDMSTEYFVFYFIAAVLSIILGVVVFVVDFVVKNSDTKNLIGRSFFIVDRSFLRPGSLFIFVPFLVFIALTVLISVIVGGGGTGLEDGRLFYPANPYTSGGLQANDAALAANSFFDNMFLGAVVPGFFEEAVIFFGWQAITASLLFLLWIPLRFKRWWVENPLPYWGITLFISLPLASAGFALAHGRYGGDLSAYLWAFSFEYIVQLANGITGFFGSWLPHMAHNFYVIGQNAYGWALASILLIPKSTIVRWLHK